MKKIIDFINTTGKLLIRYAWRNMRLIIGILTVTSVFLILKVNSYTENVNRGSVGKPNPAPCRGNSDSPEDQELKCAVRTKFSLMCKTK